jgi:hypothetical protein
MVVRSITVVPLPRPVDLTGTVIVHGLDIPVPENRRSYVPGSTKNCQNEVSLYDVNGFALTLPVAVEKMGAGFVVPVA